MFSDFRCSPIDLISVLYFTCLVTSDAAQLNYLISVLYFTCLVTSDAAQLNYLISVLYFTCLVTSDAAQLNYLISVLYFTCLVTSDAAQLIWYLFCILIVKWLQMQPNWSDISPVFYLLSDFRYSPIDLISVLYFTCLVTSGAAQLIWYLYCILLV